MLSYKQMLCILTSIWLLHMLYKAFNKVDKPNLRLRESSNN